MDKKSIWVLTPDEWKILLKGARNEVYKKSDILLAEGDKNTAIFQVSKGTLVLERNKQAIAKLEENSIAGELAYLTKTPNSAFIIANGDVEVYKFEGPYLDLLACANPKLAAKFFYYLYCMLDERIGIKI